MTELTLKVSELFYSLQGEGARAGTATVFVRLQGCKAQHACYASGIRCDTEFESGRLMNLAEIDGFLQRTETKEITWTGGEPTDQLTNEHVQYFKNFGYYQAIETSGLNRTPEGLDFICISPKVAEHVVKKNFEGIHVNELRYVRHKGQSVPQPAIKADHYWISPHSDGFTINAENLKHCIELCKQNPLWKLSIQQHKIWNVL